MTRLLLFGSGGQLGVELVRLLAGKIDMVALSRTDVDLTDGAAIRAAIQAAQPQVILNAAAYTAVDRAESEPDLARAVNTAAPGVMAEEAQRGNAWLIHFSTDYVFDGTGTKPSEETDIPHPLNVYGQTKLAGEQAIAATGCRHLIFRTSWVYSSHGINFLRTMLRLGAQRPSLSIVNDQTGAPTSANELARATESVLHKLQDGQSAPPESGIYHMTCTGSTTWFGFAKAIFTAMDGHSPAPALVPIPSEQYPTPAVRPRNSVLNCAKLERALGVRLSPWQKALDEVIAEIKQGSE